MECQFFILSDIGNKTIKHSENSTLSGCFFICCNFLSTVRSVPHIPCWNLYADRRKTTQNARCGKSCFFCMDLLAGFTLLANLYEQLLLSEEQSKVKPLSITLTFHMANIIDTCIHLMFPEIPQTVYIYVSTCLLL